MRASRRGPPDLRRRADRVLDQRRRRRRPRQLQRGALVQPKVGALAILATIVRRTDRVGLGKRSARFMRRTIAGPEPIDVVGDPDRRSDRALEQPVHEDLAASPLGAVVLADAGEQVVRLVDDDDRPSRDAADRVGDQQRRDALARLGSPFASLVSPTNWTEKPTRAPSVLANSLLPVPGGP